MIKRHLTLSSLVEIIEKEGADFLDPDKGTVFVLLPSGYVVEVSLHCNDMRAIYDSDDAYAWQILKQSGETVTGVCSDELIETIENLNISDIGIPFSEKTAIKVGDVVYYDPTNMYKKFKDKRLLKKVKYLGHFLDKGISSMTARFKVLEYGENQARFKNDIICVSGCFWSFYCKEFKNINEKAVTIALEKKFVAKTNWERVSKIEDLLAS